MKDIKELYDYCVKKKTRVISRVDDKLVKLENWDILVFKLETYDS